MKRPNSSIYTDNDLAQYKEILEHSCAHRRDVKPSSQINGNQSFKYKNIIQKLVQRSPPPYNLRERVGKGISSQMQLTANNIDFVYWNDPNELVDRLRLLIASQHAGHTNHNNEIISIIEELKKANIIN